MAAPDQLKTLLDRVNQAAQSYTPINDLDFSRSTGTSRHELLRAARQLVSALEDPEEEVWRFVLQPNGIACLVSAIECGIVAPWPKETMTSAELAAFSKADQKLVVRLMRTLVLYGIFEEKEEELYIHTGFSAKVSVPPFQGIVLRMTDRTTSHIPPIYHLPYYLAKIGYQNPGDDPNAPSLFQVIKNTDLEFFEWMQVNANPGYMEEFNASMAKSLATDKSARIFADTYPFETLESTEEVVLVDVGGGYGHVLEEIRKHVPGLKGKMVLEDLAKTVEKHADIENLEVVPYNFLTDVQPVKGARAYLMRHVLADWPDHICRKILQNIIPAMVRGRSRILIAEVILPPMDAPAFGSLFDILMMKFGGSGRKERMWRELFESVGLEVVKIWPPVKNDSIMELALKSQ